MEGFELKDKFWTENEEGVQSIPRGKKLVIGADFDGFMGEGKT